MAEEQTTLTPAQEERPQGVPPVLDQAHIEGAGEVDADPYGQVQDDLAGEPWPLALATELPSEFIEFLGKLLVV